MENKRIEQNINIQAFRNMNLNEISDQELERLKNMTDDEVLKASTTLDLFSIAESMRRLKNALHREEKAIKILTIVLIVLTVLLVILTAILVCKGK